MTLPAPAPRSTAVGAVHLPRAVVRPAPRADGPFDDELAEPAPPPVVGSLALAFPPSTRSSVPLRLVPPALGADPDEGRPAADLPDPAVWTRRLAQAVVEVLAGARPAAQLSRFASLEVLGLLERGAGRFGGRAGGPARRPLVASVHVSRPCRGVAEACAVVDTGSRRRAVALRIEDVGGRWCCTALQVG